MDEEIMLKQKYNDLLKSLKKGEEYVKANPENEDYKKRLEEIGNEIQNIMKMFPNMTVDEMENGFAIEQTNKQINEQAAAQVVQTTTTVPQITQKTVVKTNNTLTQNFKNNWEIAERLSKSSLLPTDFQGKPENVIIALGMSQKMGIDFFTIAQNLHLVKGRLSWSGSFCKTLIEKTGQYKDLNLVYVGKEGTDERGCYLEAIRIRDNKKIKGTTVTVALAKKEGWWSRKDKNGKETSKWSTMTEQMLGYRAMAFFARLYTPEALNGVITTEESLDISISNEQPQDIL